MNVLFLFESTLPERYDRKTLSPGELRVIAALDSVKKIYALSPMIESFYEISSRDKKTDLERKIVLRRFSWFGGLLGYYFTWILLLWQGWRLLKKEKIDVIHCESPHISGISGLLLKWVFHIPVIIEYRASYDAIFDYRYPHFLATFLCKTFWIVASFTMNSVDGVLANSKTYQEMLQKKLRQTNIGFYCPGIRKPAGFKKKNKSSIKTIGFLGRFYADKGPRYFVEMVYLGADYFRRNLITFLMAGDGPEKSLIVEYLNTHDLNDLVTLVGTMNRWKFLGKISILVNTQVVMAALEMVNVEASILGIPVVSFGGEGVPETVMNNETGFVVPTGDSAALMSRVCRLIDDDNLYIRFSMNAVKHSLIYSYTNQIYQLNQFYSRILI